MANGNKAILPLGTEKNSDLYIIQFKMSHFKKNKKYTSKQKYMAHKWGNKGKNRYMGLIKLRSFCLAKETVNRYSTLMPHFLSSFLLMHIGGSR